MTEGLDLTFEHIDWADIVDAEQSGDQEAIQELMYVNFILVYCKCTNYALVFRDRSLQLRKEKSQQLTSPTVLPFEEYLNSPEGDNKEAGHSLSSTPSISAYIRSTSSYADIARGHKRTLDERSPVDVSTKRPAVFTSPVMQTPVVDQTNSPMETSTPDNDRPLKVAAQRRLFDRENPLDENSPPCTQQIDPIHRQNQRQKQIDFGKKTIGYTRYSQMVPK